MTFVRAFLRTEKGEFSAAGHPPAPEPLSEPLIGRLIRPEVPRSFVELVSSMRERALFLLTLAPRVRADAATLR